jgi:hypothetical protein
MPSRWSGRVNNKKSSSSGMAENSPHLVVHLRVRSIGMLTAHSSGLHLARRPVEAFGHSKPFLARHGAKNLNLFRPGLFIGQHEKTMHCRGNRRKRRGLGSLAAWVYSMTAISKIFLV